MAEPEVFLVVQSTSFSALNRYIISKWQRFFSQFSLSFGRRRQWQENSLRLFFRRIHFFLVVGFFNGWNICDDNFVSEAGNVDVACFRDICDTSEKKWLYDNVLIFKPPAAMMKRFLRLSINRSLSFASKRWGNFFCQPDFFIVWTKNRLLHSSSFQPCRDNFGTDEKKKTNWYTNWVSDCQD